MAAEISEGTKDCMAKIDRIIEDALGHEASGNGSSRGVGSNIRLDMKGIGDYSPSVSPMRKPASDISKLTFSPVREGYPSSKTTSSLSAHSESPTKESFFSDSIKESRFTPSTTDNITDNWVNYQFERLVTDRKNNPKVKTTNEFSSAAARVPKVKSVEEILREYSTSEPLPTKGYYSSMSSFRNNNNLLKVGMMNRSHNNEALTSVTRESDQVRRVGSSVDGDVGDVLKSFGAKCSLSGTRCSSSQMLDDAKSLGLPRDSEVDFKPSSSGSGRLELGDIRTDLSDLNYSFQRERERLRHLETLIRKAPSGSGTGPEVIHALKTHNYSSRFLNEYSGRKAYSVTDYSKYTNNYEWKPSSPNPDYLNRASSSASYKNMSHFSPASRTNNYLSDFNPAQYTSGLMDSARRHESLERDTDYSSYGYKTGGSASGLSRTKLNRSYNAKKDRNMSKSIPDADPIKRRTTSCVKTTFSKKPSPSESRRSDTRDARRCPTKPIKPENKTGNKQQTSPCSLALSGVNRGEMPKKDVRSRNKLTKYQPYQPCVAPHAQNMSYSPKRTSSELSTLTPTPWMNQFSRLYGSGQYTSGGSTGASETQKSLWSSALCSSESTPIPEDESASEPLVSGNEATSIGMPPCRTNNKAKRGRKQLRSKSECRIPSTRVTAWPMIRQDNLHMIHNRAPSQVKTPKRKLKPKVKKGTPTGIKQKRISVKHK